MRAILLIDHGSVRAEANHMLSCAANLLQHMVGDNALVRAAHMELCEPSIATAYAKCVERGASRVVVLPFFLGPGKHWTWDIPRLTAEVAAKFPHTTYHVTPTLGIDDLILDLLDKRVSGCRQNEYLCEVCKGTPRSGEKGIPIPAAPPLSH